MANELVLSGLTLAFAKTNVPSLTITPASISITVAGTAFMDNVQAVGTSEEAILLGDVATGGWVFAQNMDATNYVSIRSGTAATNLIKMLPGEWAMFRMDSAASAPFCIANTGACNVRFVRFAA